MAISIETSSFGKLASGEEVKRYLLKNQNGFEVAVLSLGVTIQSIKIKDKNGKLVNIALSLETLEEYLDTKYNRWLNGVIGRTANRIRNAEFTQNGVKYKIEKNEGENSLHGGFSGYHMKNWKSTIESDGVKFTLFSHDSEGGYPGDVNAEIILRLDAKTNQLTFEYKATTTKPTPIDLSHHVLLNLNGHDSGTPIYNHEVKIHADSYLETNKDDFLMTGEIKPVDKTIFDFKDYVQLGERMKNEEFPRLNSVYHTYHISNQQTGKRYLASVRNPSNGINFDVWSNQNGVIFYTGDFLDITVPSTGVQYKRHYGFLFEDQNYPDAMNNKHFPSSTVLPEGEYYHQTTWLFSVDSQ